MVTARYQICSAALVAVLSQARRLDCDKLHAEG
jgi:hypothetical protein